MIFKNETFKVLCIKTNATNELVVGNEYIARVCDNGDLPTPHYAIMTQDNLFVGVYSQDLFKLMPNGYDYINPNHYKQGDKETWEKMLEIWGKEAFIKHCEITAFKYIQRLGKKPNNSVEQDIEKARWYLNKAYDIKNL